MFLSNTTVLVSDLGLRSLVTRGAASEPSVCVLGTSQPLASPAGLLISFQPPSRPGG